MRGGDQDRGFHQFVADRSAALLRLAYLLCADRATAEDIVQTALVRAYLRWRSIVSNPEAYVRRIVVTVAADERRRAYRAHEVPTGQVTDAADPADPQASIEAIHGLQAALRSLPPRQRAAVVLRHWVGLDPAEVADLMDCTAETVRSQTARGLEKLRAAYVHATTDPIQPGK